MKSLRLQLCTTTRESSTQPFEPISAQSARERSILNAAPDGIFIADQEGCIRMANTAMVTLTGYTLEYLVGKNIEHFLHTHSRVGQEKLVKNHFLSLETRVMESTDFKLLCCNGISIAVDISVGQWEDEFGVNMVAYVRDLTERKKFEESLRYQATHDGLTDLPNRWLFGLQLEQALSRAGRTGLQLAVFSLDLDNFKNINDSFGHAAGDAVLVQVSERIHGALRENDILARLGGDEFAILLSDLKDVEEAIGIASRLLTALQAAYGVNSQDVYSGGSLGIAFYPDDAADGETLLRFADMAMYRAKQAGRGTYTCYSHEMNLQAHRDMQLHNRLKEAIATAGLELHYQPQVDVNTDEIVGAEALLRWNDAELGNVSPARFIPVAEATGLILPLSDWVLNTACRQIAEWTRGGFPLRVAVNFSAQMFGLRNLPELVRTALAKAGAEARWLDIEITESVAMRCPEQAREQLVALVALGCRIVLDDFGTGYSSLAYLKELPVNKLKIDRSFIQGIPDDASDTTISRAIIALAHSLGMTLVAEGVETNDQLRFLRRFGCEVYQGWFFAKALSAPEFSQLRAQNFSDCQ